MAQLGRSSIRTRRPAWAPVGAACVMHGLVLVGWLAAGTHTTITAPPAQPGLSAIQTRVWTDPASLSVPASAARSEDADTGAVGGARPEESHDAASSRPSPGAQMHEPPLRPAGTPSDHLEAQADPDPAPPSPAQADTHWPPGSDEYLPRSLLTRAPVARSDIWLGYPDDAPNGRFEATLLVFIDEHGLVRHVRPDADRAMPASLIDLAQQAFLGARFEPGELNGQAVKSRIAIAVTFEANSAPRSTGVR